MHIHRGLLSDLLPQVQIVVMIGNRASDHLRELARIAEFKGRAAYRIDDLGNLTGLRAVASDQRNDVAIAVGNRVEVSEQCPLRRHRELIDGTVLPSQIVGAAGRNRNLTSDQRRDCVVGENVVAGFRIHVLVAIGHHQSQALADAFDEVACSQGVTKVVVGSDSKRTHIGIHGAEYAIEVDGSSSPIQGDISRSNDLKAR